MPFKIFISVFLILFTLLLIVATFSVANLSETRIILERYDWFKSTQGIELISTFYTPYVYVNVGEQRFSIMPLGSGIVRLIESSRIQKSRQGTELVIKARPLWFSAILISFFLLFLTSSILIGILRKRY